MTGETRDIRVVMPQLGESIVEATLARWHVRPGDRVERGQVLAEVETDKATNELPAPAAGTIATLLIAEGQTVPVGVEILLYAGEAQARPAETTPAAVVAAAAAPEPGPARSPRDRLPSRHLASRPVAPNGQERLASPAVRRMARARGIDLTAVPGTGKRGRITREDVLSFSGKPAISAAPAPVTPALPAGGFKVYRPPAYEPQPGDEVVPFSRRRTFIAEHMVHSLGTAAHVAAVVEIDLARVVAARAKDRQIAEAQGVHLTFTAYVVQAVARALLEHPELNATVRGETVVLRRERNIGVAVDTPEGLIVPVIHRADELGLLGIARAISRHTEKARAGALTAADLSGGSFTISNPGKDGNLFGISIIRQPEVAILRMGEVTKRPVVRTIDGEDAIVIRPIMFAALSYDHRVIDGSKGNAFLHRVRALLEAQAPALSPPAL